jgi:hypothetical protein
MILNTARNTPPYGGTGEKIFQPHVGQFSCEAFPQVENFRFVLIYYRGEITWFYFLTSPEVK